MDSQSQKFSNSTDRVAGVLPWDMIHSFFFFFFSLYDCWEDGELIRIRWWSSIVFDKIMSRILWAQLPTDQSRRSSLFEIMFLDHLIVDDAIQYN